MKKINLLLMLMLLLLILIGCTSKTSPASAAPQASPEPGSLDAQLQAVKDTAAAIVSNATASAVPQQSAGQTVYVPVPQGSGVSTEGAISANYASPCLLERYRVLNSYCWFKTFWHNQSTLMSWYVPYSFISLLAFILIIIIIWHLWRSK